jgi:hypothetical protein
MTLLEKINSDLISSMKAKEKDRLNVIRMLKSAVQMKKIELNHDLSDEEIIDVISKQIKMRRESIKEFVAANREDLASQYQKEIEVLNEYMPMQISLEEATKIIDEAFNKINPESNKQMGLIMKEVSPKLKGVFDMGEASKIIREKLNNL